MSNVTRRALLSRSLAGLALTPWTNGVHARALGYPQLLEGPMVGAPSPTSFTVWARASDALDVQVEYSTDRNFTQALRTPAIRAEATLDLITIHRVEGLKPDSTYYYRMLVDGARDRLAPVPFRTRTAPAGAADFRVAYGSCARIQIDSVQPIFSAVALNEPDLFFWLGDNIYADTQESSAMADLYRRQRAVKNLQPLIGTIPQLAIWDDHDFGYNDADGTSPIKEDRCAYSTVTGRIHRPAHRTLRASSFSTRMAGSISSSSMAGITARHRARPMGLPGACWVRVRSNGSKARFARAVRRSRSWSPAQGGRGRGAMATSGALTCTSGTSCSTSSATTGSKAWYASPATSISAS